MKAWAAVQIALALISPMHTRLVDLWYPMRSTRLDREERATFEEEAIAHWLSQLGKSLELLSSNLNQVAVEVTEAPESVLRSLARDSPLISLGLYTTVHVRALVTFDETQPTHPKETAPPDEGLWPSFLSFYLSHAFRIACLASQLSRPGCFIFDKAHTFIEGRPIERVDGVFRLQVADSAADLASTWPTLRRPDLIDVVSWLKSISAFSPPVATTRLQRAFAAFTYLVGHRGQESEGETLFRAMQGLEAFYCDGIGDLRKQLSDKTQLWLGLAQSPANLVGKLYDLRSKYIHGSAAMPYAVSIEDPDEHAPKAMGDFYSGVTLATRLLVATIQRCVVEKVREVRWDYSFQTEGGYAPPSPEFPPCPPP